MRDYFKDLGVSPNVIVEFDDAHALLNIARLGRLATFIAMTHPADGPGLRPLRLPGKSVRFIAVAMWSRLTPAAKAFLEVASAQNVRFQPLISG
jgi:DNA-binding transcriptional LysR family regulator